MDGRTSQSVDLFGAHLTSFNLLLEIMENVEVQIHEFIYIPYAPFDANL